MSRLDEVEPSRAAPAVPMVESVCAGGVPPNSLTSCGTSTSPTRIPSAAVEVDLYTAAVISRCWWPPLANSAICRMAARLDWRRWLMFAGTPPLASSGRTPAETTYALTARAVAGSK